MTMHQLPRPVLGSEGTRNPQGEGTGDASFGNRRCPALDLENRREVRRNIFGDGLDAQDLPLTKPRRSKVEGVRGQFPASHGGTEGICQRDIISMRENGFDRHRVSSRECIERGMVQLNNALKVHPTPPSLKTRPCSRDQRGPMPSGAVRAVVVNDFTRESTWAGASRPALLLRGVRQQPRVRQQNLLARLPPRERPVSSKRGLGPSGGDVLVLLATSQRRIA